MGVFEDARFASGTEAVARAVAKSDAVSVVAAVTRWRRCKPLVSRATSASSRPGEGSLELVELGDLPGLRALRESPFN